MNDSLEIKAILDAYPDVSGKEKTKALLDAIAVLGPIALEGSKGQAGGSFMMLLLELFKLFLPLLLELLKPKV